jgi:hypothetical protein
MILSMSSESHLSSVVKLHSKPHINFVKLLYMMLKIIMIPAMNCYLPSQAIS